MPTDFMKTAVVPFIKYKTGVISDENNYIPIALVTVTSRLYEILQLYLITQDNWVGCKTKHFADMCIFTVKT